MPGNWIEALVKYQLDPTAQNPNNKIEDEPHVIDKTTNYIFALRGGPFYVDSLVIKHPVTGLPLSPNSQYKVLQPYQDASVAMGHDIACIVLIEDLNIIPATEEEATIYIDYQVVGGIFSWNIYAINEMLSQITLPINVEWNAIVGKLDLYPPAPHYQPINMIFGWNYLASQLEGVRLAIERLRPDYVYPESVMPDIIQRLINVEAWMAAHGGGFHDSRYYLKGESDNLFMLKTESAYYLRRTGDTMQGPLYLVRHPQANMEAATRQWVLGLVENLDIDTINNYIASHNHDGSYYTKEQSDGRYVKKAGDVMEGFLILAREPEQPMEAAPRQWVLDRIGELNLDEEAIRIAIGELTLVIENHNHDDKYISLSEKGDFVKKAGDQMGGPLYGYRDAIEPNEFVRLGQLGNASGSKYVFKPHIKGYSQGVSDLTVSVHNPGVGLNLLIPRDGSGIVAFTGDVIKIEVELSTSDTFATLVSSGFCIYPYYDDIADVSYPDFHYTSSYDVGDTYYARARVIAMNPDDNFASILEIGEWSNTGVYNSNGQVNRPSVLFPTDQSTGISLTPTITTSVFSNQGPADTHIETRWTISGIKNPDGSGVGGTIINTVSSVNLTSLPIAAGLFVNDQSYRVSVSHRGSIFGWSTVSEYVVFRTGATPSIGTPSVLTPLANAVLTNPNNVLATFSNYVANNGSHAHTSTDIEIRATASDTGALIHSTNVTSNLTQYTIPNGVMSYGGNYHIRVRYRSNGIVSSWSAFRSFSIGASTDGELIFSDNSTTPGEVFENEFDVTIPSGVSQISLCLVGKGGDSTAGRIDYTDPNTRYRKGIWYPESNNVAPDEFKLETSIFNGSTYYPDFPKIAKTPYGVFVFAGNKYYKKASAGANWVYQGLLEDIPSSVGSRTDPIWVGMTAVVSIGSVIYLVGGSLPDGSAEVRDTVFAFNTQTNKLNQLAPLGMPVSRGHIAALGNEFYYVGGKQASGIGNDIFIKYNVNTQVTTALSTPSDGVTNTSTAFTEGLGNRLTALGNELYGSYYNTAAARYDLLKYTPSTNVWSVASSNPVNDASELVYYRGSGTSPSTDKTEIPRGYFHGDYLVTISGKLFGCGLLPLSYEPIMRVYSYTLSNNKIDRYSDLPLAYTSHQFMPYEFNGSLYMVSMYRPSPSQTANTPEPGDFRLDDTIVATGVSKSGMAGAGGVVRYVTNVNITAGVQYKVRISNLKTSFGYIDGQNEYVEIVSAPAGGSAALSANGYYRKGITLNGVGVSGDGGSSIPVYANDVMNPSMIANYWLEAGSGAGGGGVNGYALNAAVNEYVFGGGGGAGGYLGTGAAGRITGYGLNAYFISVGTSTAPSYTAWGGPGGNSVYIKSILGGLNRGGGGGGGIGLVGFVPYGSSPSENTALGKGGNDATEAGSGGSGGIVSQYTLTSPDGGAGNGYGGGAGAGAGPGIQISPGVTTGGAAAIGGPGAVRIIWGSGRTFPYGSD